MPRPKRYKFQFSEKTELCELKEKRRTRDLQHSARSTVEHGSHRAVQVMQSDVNLHTAGKIVGCKIVCTISHSCNSIIIHSQKKKKE